jgi:predicted AAA+ superfamily ATPase
VYIERALTNQVTENSRHFPVVLINGPRQVGKTTLLKNMAAPDRTYVTLDDPTILELAVHDPHLFMQKFPAPVFIDEIQYAPNLLPYIKMAVDGQRIPGSFWLTGSQQFHLMKNVSESLAGRVAILTLLGISRQEILGKDGHSIPFLPTPQNLDHLAKNRPILELKELFRLIWQGSFPQIITDTTINHHVFYSSYIQTYLQRDVKSMEHIGDDLSFFRFLRAIAARTGQLLNLAETSRDADITPILAKKWLSVLQNSGLVYLLEPYYNNVTKRMIKSPKVYFLDTGLAAYLTEWSSPENLEAGAMSGAFLETWIIGEILKSWLNNGKRPPLYYYRDKDQKEIDLLIIQDHTIYPLECKKTAKPDKQIFKPFTLLEQFKLTIGSGGVICLYPTLLPLTETFYSIPISVL